MKMISGFESGSNFGGGVITTECLKYFNISKFCARKNIENIYLRNARTLFNWLKTPFLHPIFCAYRNFEFLKSDEDVILNFSQTFSMLYNLKGINSSIIAHDLLIQKRLFLQKWISFSERIIFNKAKRVYVLSNKDARILRRFYKIPDYKITNVFNLIFKIDPIKIRLKKNIKWKLFFLGSFDRAENLEAFDWFYEHVYRKVSQEIEVEVIGINSKVHDYDGIKFIGHLESLSDCKHRYDMSIAPIRSGAGIKIKVLDSLRMGIPVLGTFKAYEGFHFPNAPFVSNDASKWISTLESDILEFTINY